MIDQPSITGVQINYYFVCHRKLWFFSRHIQMEHNSQLVEEGDYLHRYSYERKKKEIQIGGVKIDFLDKANGVIHEVKKSRAVEESHIRQLKYYLYYFKKLGLDLKGSIDYPLLRKRKAVELTPEDESEIENIINEIKGIVAQDSPPPLAKSKICKKCGYYEMCFI